MTIQPLTPNLLTQYRWFFFWDSGKGSYLGLDDLAAAVIVILGTLAFIDGPLPYIPGLTDFYKGLWAEMIGQGIGVFIANAGEYVSNQAEKKRLILQMGSPNNDFAIETVRQLRSRGWVHSGMPKKAVLNGADLRGATLWGANLSRQKWKERT